MSTHLIEYGTVTSQEPRQGKMVDALSLLGHGHNKYIPLCLISRSGFPFWCTSMLLDKIFHHFIFLEENNLDKITLGDVSHAQQWQCNLEYG